ncbi:MULTISPECIES: winged helix-turn-helix transcriptional regulator [Geobacter]|uniref:Transcriptional regulator n=2 Tax=Geobacter TaxID=28231 RepID=A0A0C1TKG3_9BACT|nr:MULTISPECIES: winged helix-turn-helix transcriptional regulator [Geobacter]ANA39552.1 transcriptional regulator [Geobacter anodireducens]KIE41299.1 transcriptional regulator [Geobacter soli]MBE2888569.1 winged helix-turn-helix transcriptional regulator [Geobacter anodireducens]HMN03061.1 winged helix-turn-helix transcriptional regulator [Geobacter anodireducens]
MNDLREKDESYRSFLLLSAISSEEPLSQREIARQVGIALGLVNSYLKHLVDKGFVRIKSFPRNRYAYLLTPRGLAEKSRLAYEHLSSFTTLFRVARQDYLALFRALRAQGIGRVAFCGVDEVAEIAYLSLREVGLELALVMDQAADGREFFGKPVVSIPHGLLAGNHHIVITTFKRREALREELLQRGAAPELLHQAGEPAGEIQSIREEHP